MRSINEFVDLTIDLVRRPSYWGNAEEQKNLGNYICNWFGKRGIKAESDDLGSVLVNSEAPVILCGHLDVVAPAGEATYQPSIKEDKVVGRGTSDMKGALAVMMKVIVDLHDQYDVGFVGTVTEEAEYAKTGADILCEKGVFNETKFLIVGEPTVDDSSGRMYVAVGSEGAYDWTTKIFTDGSPYHAANLHLADNAISVALSYVKSLMDTAEIAGSTIKKFKRTFAPWTVPRNLGPINVGKIRGGEQATWTPNFCEVEFEKRLFPSESSMAFHDSLKKFSKNFENENVAKLELETLWTANPYLLDPSSSGFKFVKNWVEKANLEVGFWNATGDMSKIYNYLKCEKRKETPTVIMGPGILSRAHRSDEHVNISDLDKAYTHYVNLVKEIFRRTDELDW